VVTRLVKAPRIDFASLRRELELPTRFPLAAQREADEAAAQVAAGLTAQAASAAVADRTDIPFVTIDPATSRDLDQALSLHRRAGGFRVFYAIADVTQFVPVGGQLEAETWRRGETVYLPDGKVPLHPLSLSEGAASLLPGETRAAVLWTVDLDADGRTTAVRVERAVVRSRAKLDYETVQKDAAAGQLDEPIALLPEVGALLLARALDRGAINLPIPEQELEPDHGGWRLRLRAALAAEAWNAQISLLTGMCAADIMLAGRVGLLRTMPAPRPEAVDALRAIAAVLGLHWVDGESVGRLLATVDPASPRGAAFVDQAAELMRGASYTAVDGDVPQRIAHSGVGAPYAHVTAPLRRLADRYATEVCLSLVQGREVPDWIRAALPQLPDIMEKSGRRAAAAERGAIDLAEAVLLEHRIGEEFSAAVLDVAPARSNANGAERPGMVTIAIDEPPVRARCEGTAVLGERVRVRLTRADPTNRTVLFELVPKVRDSEG
jgi:exoribonuclease R